MKIHLKFSAHCAAAPALPWGRRIILILVIMTVLIGHGNLAVIETLLR